ncbi:nitroreductase/quinone reductase family protein [Antrihabitans cavernicola]|uniref:Nitroreductase family deazaflavin-dependent oxidoreductase n=1 Tax=Antrihabitans cavernicola TaxID=2495913 RepID=A0A5A7S7H6_9NOCA|nr:nitroreductase/quinone reductase family protein [Spelaeibacter cavernicola]KAA0022110.1 nitroreductase family deazaflavin-dependent oxidoreductase [Spelaeibacter cavernicola]
MSEQAFPDVRWGSDSGFLNKAAIAFASTPVGSWVIKTATPLDRKLLVKTDGKYTILGPIGAPVILLTTKGRKSGEPRTTPLLCVHEGDKIYVVGSNFGQAHHPAWTANLLADSNASVAIGGKAIPVVATPVIGTEQTRVYKEFIDMAGAYEAYKGRTDRDLRVFALTRR